MTDREKMNKHTPGPWIANVVNAWPEQVGCCPLIGRPYSISFGSNNVAAAVTIEDAILIAAAPDLLEALQGLLRGIANGPDEANAAMLVAKARDAINKATGKD